MTNRERDLFSLLLSPATGGRVQFGQATVLAWDPTDFTNRVQWRGNTLTNLPIIEGMNALSLVPGDTIGLLGYTPEEQVGVGSWWILGKITAPTGDTSVSASRIVANPLIIIDADEDRRVLIGKNTDGSDVTILYYGNDAASSALTINRSVDDDTLPGNNIQLTDYAGHTVVATDIGTGVGLSHPHLNYVLYPSNNAELSGQSPFPSTASTSFTPLWEGVLTLWHPRIAYRFVKDGSGEVDWRIIIDGTEIANGTGVANGVAALPDWGTTFRPGDQVRLNVQARVASGSRVWLGIETMAGVGS